MYIRRFLLSASVLISAGAQAQTVGIGEDTFTIGLGGVFADFDTKLRVDDKNLDLGTVIDLEDDLRFDESDNYVSLGMTWRFAPRHRIGLLTNQSSRNTTATTTEDIEFEDALIPAGSNVSLDFDVDIYEIVYMYSFIQQDNMELSGAVGIHWIDTGLVLDSNVLDIARDADTNGPLPNIGLDFVYGFTDQWRGVARAQLLALEYDKYDGSMYDLMVGAEYHFQGGFVLGAAYNMFRIDIDVDDDNWFGNLEYKIQGPSVFLNYRW